MRVLETQGQSKGVRNTRPEKVGEKHKAERVG